MDGEFMLVGLLQYEDIINRFAEWQESDQYAEVEPQVIEKLKKIDEPLKVLCFLGTWCSDSRDGVPPFMKSIQAADNPFIEVELIGVDRQEDDPQHLGPQYHITRVPTFVILKNGKEISRMVEFPQKSFAEDFTDIVMNLK